MIKNRTYTYLFPEFIQKIKIPEKYIKGVFLGIKNVTKNLTGNIFIWVKTDTPIIKKNYVQTHTMNNNLIIEYKYPNKKNYNNFIDGRYSQIDSVTKRQIVNYHNLKKTNKIYGILYKSSILRNQMEKELKVDLKNYELGEKPNIQEELYE